MKNCSAARRSAGVIRILLTLSACVLSAATGYCLEASLTPGKTKGGQGFLLSISGPATGYYEVSYNDKIYRPFGALGKERIFLPVRIEDRGKKKITIRRTSNGEEADVRQAWIRIAGRPKKTVYLKEKDEKLRADEPMKEEQNRMVLEKLRTRSEEKLWSQGFMTPIEAPIATRFALQRKASTYQYYHKGIDYSSPKGTAVRASNDGLVIYAKSGLNVYGNTMMIDHGQGVVSCYFHLNRFLKKEGERAAKGEVIAEVGSTGWATGPHLHFGIYLQGEAVDPLWWIRFTRSPKISGG